MAKHLVIVESPTKARTMARYLGPDFVIDASMGHVRDLPVKEFGVDIEHDFTPTYEVSEDKKKIVSALRKQARAAEVVYLAPDPDREGEAIAWHLKEALDLPDEKVRRVTFDEFTKSAIQRAFESPGALRMDLVNAQQARRILDRIVGYKISPLLWRRIQRGLSAGRVQSVAVRMVVDREKEIRAFEARPLSDKEYWTVTAIFSRKDRMKETFEAQLKLREKKELKTGQEAEALLSGVAPFDYRVSRVEEKDQVVAAPPPFSTDLLLRHASNRLGFSARKTSILAQQLYEGMEVGSRGVVGLITYMRTDSYNLAAQAVEAARSFIETAFGQAYVPPRPNVFRSSAGAQEAHEAIRPTDVTLTPDEAKPYLSHDQHRLYELIWRRFVACQMPPARYKNTVVEIPAGERVFEARGKQQLFDGFTRVLGRPDKDQILPPLAVGNELHRHDLVPTQHFEQPPPRYNESTLVRELKKQGIGRPSTYVPIISTIQTRKYVVLKEEEKQGDKNQQEEEEEKEQEQDSRKRRGRKRKKFHPTDLGEVVTEQLVEHFPTVLDPQFTSQMEANLDRIAEEGEDWLKVLRDFYGPFAERLKKAGRDLKVPERKSTYTCPECAKPLVYKFARGGWFLACPGYPDCKYTARVDKDGRMLPKEEPRLTDIDCPECGKKMVVRDGRYGKFLACSGYPKCKTTRKLGKDGKPLPPRKTEPTGVNCPNCGSPMVRKSKGKQAFLACSAYPKCRTTQSLTPQGKPGPPKEPDLTDTDCPECGKKMVVREGRYGKFLACSGYPKCKTTRKMGEDGKPLPPGKREARGKPGPRKDPELTDVDCPECGKKMVIREGRYGKFLACSGYPKCKTTRKLTDETEPGS